MAFESAADRAAMMASLGEPVVVAGRAVTGIFDHGFDAVLGAESSHPILILTDEDASGLARGDAVAAGGRSFTVAGIRPDGTGMTTLILEAA